MKQENKAPVIIANSYDSTVKTVAAYRYQLQHCAEVSAEIIPIIEKLYAEAYSRYNSYASTVSKNKLDNSQLKQAAEALKTVFACTDIEGAKACITVMDSYIPVAQHKGKKITAIKVYELVEKYLVQENITIEEFAEQYACGH